MCLALDIIARPLPRAVTRTMSDVPGCCRIILQWLGKTRHWVRFTIFTYISNVMLKEKTNLGKIWTSCVDSEMVMEVTKMSYAVVAVFSPMSSFQYSEYAVSWTGIGSCIEWETTLRALWILFVVVLLEESSVQCESPNIIRKVRSGCPSSSSCQP